jgi:hypothetical protein
MNARKFASGESGQALIEWALLLMLFGQLFVALAVFSEWFVVRQELMAATKEGALLYSAGRLEIPEVKRLMQRALQRGRPALTIPLDDIFVGPSDDNQAAFMQLDKVSVRYRPRQFLLRYFANSLEESCVIKHAPSYGHPGVLGFGPPVAWQRT